jgi:hypothetical protein
MEGKGSRGPPGSQRTFFIFERASSSPSRLFENCTLDDQSGSCVALPTPGEMKILGEILLNLKHANAILGDRPFTFY